jgi:endonuclease YncB( thermonuclease family)
MSLLQNATRDVPEFSLNGKVIPAKVVDCYDGDTFYAVIELEGKLWKFNCRMNGYDTPEMKPPKNKPGRDVEKAKALKAKQALLSQICSGVDLICDLTKDEMDLAINNNAKIITLICKEFDKYGRLLVEVQSLSPQKTVNDWMVEQGYGYRYTGGTKDNTFGTTL